MRLGEQHITDPETGNVLGQYRPADQDSVYKVISADIGSLDGRSEWLWIRLTNGDLILGIFPQGDTYFETEGDHSR